MGIEREESKPIGWHSMTFAHRARRFLRRFGIDVSRYPDQSVGGQLARLLRHHEIDLVVDVGASTGDYVRELRAGGYRGRVVSFEPLPQALPSLRQRAAADGSWEVIGCALGPEDGPVVLNVAGNAGASSSVLGMLPRHARAAPESSYVGQVLVEQRRLDALWPDVAGDAQHVFLKIDVQGYEERVLKGAIRSLAACAGLQIEVSLVPLYEAGFDLDGGLRLAEQHGFQLEALVPGFTDPTTGQLLQTDLVLFRADADA